MDNGGAPLYSVYVRIPRVWLLVLGYLQQDSPLPQSYVSFPSAAQLFALYLSPLSRHGPSLHPPAVVRMATLQLQAQQTEQLA